MSCHSTSGGLVSTSLARGITGLTEKEVQHIFHALKREAQGMAAPSELQIKEWRARQYDLLTRMKRMTDKRRDTLRDRLFRTRGESVPDGATFHAWTSVEARARQEVALREIGTAVDLDPPGSHAHRYDLGEDGRPKRVWYASYGSNLHRDRFMNYIQGGSPEGSTRTYTGCTDPTEPVADIPIRFAGARPHFALTSRVWHGGIAFIDATKGESAQGLGRAYDIGIDQFDEVVAQENGTAVSAATPIQLDEALTTGRSVIGNGSYETILHIGDYEGAPVLTFTAPFSTREALTKTGHILRTPVGQAAAVRMPVMTNKPSPAYLRMIGGGLAETFDMDEIAQADYLRGCPGGDRWTRQQMVRILRGEQPDPERAPGPENPTQVVAGKTTTTAGNNKRSKGAEKTTSNTNGALPDKNKTPATVGIAANGQPSLFSHATGPTDTQPRTSTGNGNRQRRDGFTPAQPSTRDFDTRQQRMRDQAAGIRPLGNVRTYPTIEDQETGVRTWGKTVEHANALLKTRQDKVTALERSLAGARANNNIGTDTIIGMEASLSRAEIELHRLQTYADEATTKFNKARDQTPTQYYRTDKARTLSQWQAEDERLLTQQRAYETAHEQVNRELTDLRLNPNASAADIATKARVVLRTGDGLQRMNQRLQETHDIIRTILAKETDPTPPAPTTQPTTNAATAGKTGKTAAGAGNNKRGRKGKQRNPGHTSR